MLKKCALLIVSAALFPAGACAQSLAGSWTGHFIPDGKKHASGLMEASQRAAKATVQLTIDKDGSFLYKPPATGMSKGTPIKGTWKVAGETLTLYWPHYHKEPYKTFLALSVENLGKKLLGAQGPIGHEVFAR